MISSLVRSPFSLLCSRACRTRLRPVHAFFLAVVVTSSVPPKPCTSRQHSYRWHPHWWPLRQMVWLLCFEPSLLFAVLAGVRPFEELFFQAMAHIQVCTRNLAAPTFVLIMTFPGLTISSIHRTLVQWYAVDIQSSFNRSGTPHGHLLGADGRRAVATWLGKDRWDVVFRSMKVRACDSRRTSAARV